MKRLTPCAGMETGRGFHVPAAKCTELKLFLRQLGPDLRTSKDNNCHHLWNYSPQEFASVLSTDISVKELGIAAGHHVPPARDLSLKLIRQNCPKLPRAPFSQQCLSGFDAPVVRQFGFPPSRLRHPSPKAQQFVEDRPWAFLPLLKPQRSTVETLEDLPALAQGRYMDFCEEVLTWTSGR